MNKKQKAALLDVLSLLAFMGTDNHSSVVAKIELLRAEFLFDEPHPEKPHHESRKEHKHGG